MYCMVCMNYIHIYIYIFLRKYCACTGFSKGTFLSPSTAELLLVPVKVIRYHALHSNAYFVGFFFLLLLRFTEKPYCILDSLINPLRIL